MKNMDLYKELEQDIVNAYTEGASLEDAEKLAGKFLYAQMQVSSDLSSADLDARMRKSGVKAVRAAVYMDACSKAEKKPTEGQLDHMLNISDLVGNEQDSLDKAEVLKAQLERFYEVFQQAHVYFRQISRGVQG